MEKVMDYITKFFAIIMAILALFGYGESDDADEKTAE